MKRHVVAALAFVTWAGAAGAWQLQPLSLEDRVKVSDVIVSGEVTDIVKTETSNFMGAGNCRTAKVRVTRVLKGEAPDRITVTWCKVTQAEGADPLRGESVWLLQALPDGTYQVRGSFAGVLPAASAALIEGLQALGTVKR